MGAFKNQGVSEFITEQRKQFIEKFGREPGPDDPLFFDPDADTPQPYPEESFTETIVAIYERSRG